MSMVIGHHRAQVAQQLNVPLTMSQAEEAGVEGEKVSDPVDGMAHPARQTPRTVRGFPWVVPRKSAEVDKAGGYGWTNMGPPTRNSDDELWRALVSDLDDTFADCLKLKVYSFAAPGTPRRGTKRKVSFLDIRKNVKRTYGDRLRTAQKLFGVRVMPDGWIFLIPKPVRFAFDLVKLALRGTREQSRYLSPEHRRYCTEAAHYVFVHGPPGLAALKATRDLEGAEGLRSLLETWWRL